MEDFSGRTAFITGGANGIGLGIARKLAELKVRIAIADVDASGLQRAFSELSGLTEVATYELDVRDRQAFARVSHEVEDRLGPVTLLFNNAGVAGGAHVTRLNFDAWDWMLGINIDGVVNGIQTYLPRMIERGLGGHIVNTSSGAGLVAVGGVMYSTSKFAIVGLSEALRAELERTRIDIGVSVLCPGPVATDIIARSIQSGPGTEEAKALSFKHSDGLCEFLANGLSADEVGDLVVRGIAVNSPYIFTDRIIESDIVKRTEKILGCIPKASAAVAR